MEFIVGMIVFYAIAASILWGVIVYLQTRAHRKRMDDLEGRWK